MYRAAGGRIGGTGERPDSNASYLGVCWWDYRQQSKTASTSASGAITNQTSANSCATVIAAAWVVDG
jgi:hypothetical protein